MKMLKIIDLAGQILVTALALYLWSDVSFYIFYFGVGAWQVISCLVHVLTIPVAKRTRGRRVYETVLVYVVPFGILILPVMLFIGVIMAAGYMLVCAVEIVQQYTKRVATTAMIY